MLEKRYVVGGKVYDTETAELFVIEHPQKRGWQMLGDKDDHIYRTPGGAYFSCKYAYCERDMGWEYSNECAVYQSPEDVLRAFAGHGVDGELMDWLGIAVEAA